MQVAEPAPRAARPARVWAAPNRWVQAGGLLAALVLGWLAQLGLTYRVMVEAALLAYGVAVALVVVLLATQPMVRNAFARPAPTPLSWPRTFGAVMPTLFACALAAGTFLSAGGNQIRLLTLFYWASAIVATWIAAQETPPTLPRWLVRLASYVRHPTASFTLRVPWITVAVLAVVLLGAFFRYYELDALPVEPTSDHAEKFLDIQDLVDGQRPWFFPRNTGREPWQFYTALTIAEFRGVNFLTLKLSSATAGVVSVLAIFFAARVCFGNAVGLAAAFLWAVGLWEVANARVGLRIPFAPLFSALCLLALMRIYRYGQRRDYLLLGLLFGAGLYGYTPFRVVMPPFLVLALGLTLLLRWREGLAVRLEVIKNSVLCGLIAVVVFLPLGRVMYDQPALFWGRATSRMVPADPNAPPAWLIFLDNLKNGALMFNWRGDSVFVNHLSLSPQLDPLTGALFVFGVVYAIVRLVRNREWVYAYLLLGLPVLTLASTAVIGFPLENPSTIRAGPVLPVAYLLAAIPLVLLLRRLGTLVGGAGGRWLCAAVLALSMVFMVGWNYDAYFNRYAEIYRRDAVNSRAPAEVLRGFVTSIGDFDHAWHISFPYWIDTRSIATEAGKPYWNNSISGPDAIRRAAAQPGPQLYLLHPDDQQSLALLRELHPEGETIRYVAKVSGRPFLAYLVPAPPGTVADHSVSVPPPGTAR